MKRWFALFLLLSTACADTIRHPSRGSEILVTTERDGDECVVTVAGERFLTVRLENAQLLKRLRSLGAQPMLLRFDDDTPYRCVGSAIFTLQRARAKFRVPQIPGE